MTKKTFILLLLLVLLPSLAWSQASRPGPLPPAGPPISDLDLANRLERAAEDNSNAVGTLEFSYQSSGDLWTVMQKTNPQGLFVTLEVNGKQIKNVAKNKKPKVEEAVEPGPMAVKARLSRPGKRLETLCSGEVAVGYQQVIFLPYGGKEGYFSCHVMPRLLPDEVFNAWKGEFETAQAQAYSTCASTHPRGSSRFWGCIEGAGIPLPRG